MPRVIADEPKREERQDLTPEYCHVIERVQGFGGVPDRDKQTAIRRLLQWKSNLEELGFTLPAPWVFADRQDIVEFEWETVCGDLTLRLSSENKSWYSLSLNDSEPEEGELVDADVSPILRHLLRAPFEGDK